MQTAKQITIGSEVICSHGRAMASQVRSFKGTTNGRAFSTSSRADGETNYLDTAIHISIYQTVGDRPVKLREVLAAIKLWMNLYIEVTKSL